jgi:glutaredoxin
MRLYALDNCPHCEQAKEYLDSKGVAYEVVKEMRDPVMKAGFAILFPGEPPKFPILVNHETAEATVGFSDEFRKLVDSVSSASVSDGSATEQQPVSEATKFAQEAALIT